jgi:hypothetical protein
MNQNLNLEVYEFLLKDYPYKFAIMDGLQGINDSNPNISINTKSIDSSDIDDCGVIKNEVKQSAIIERDADPNLKIRPDIFDSKITIELNHDNIRSCDPITGITHTTTYITLLAPNKEDAYKYSFKLFDIVSRDLISFSSVYGAKNTGINFSKYGEDLITEDRDANDNLTIPTYFPSMHILYDKNIIRNIIEDIKPILHQDWYSESIDVRTIDNPDEKYDILENYTLIKKINPSINDKFIIIGDIHGSYATFIRTLLRFRKMNIMNEECVLQNNHHIIFLGDIVDRGQYAYEIIMLIFLLKIKNPTCIHINRGNHEEFDMNTRDGFLNELKSKFGEVDGIDVHKKLNDVFLHQHSALLIKNPINNKYTYMAHGGLPTETYRLNLLPSFRNFDNPNNIILRNDSILANYINSIRWNDFWGYQNNIQTDNRGIKLGQSIIDKVKTPEVNIELIIRAHQDQHYNTKLILKKDEESLESNHNTFLNINELQAIGIANPDLTQKIHCYKFTHLIKVDPAGNLNINHTSIPNLLPVVTISTNTDKGRNLAKDSFVILKYIEDYNPALDGCAVVDSIEEKRIKKNRFMSKYHTEIIKLKSEISAFRSKGDFKSQEYNNKMIEYDKLTAKYREYTSGRFRGGNYYDKYMKYKQKYLQLKAGNIFV